MHVLLIDFETTGPDRAADRPWSVGCVSTNLSFAQCDGFESRMWADDYPDISDGARRVCRIEERRLVDEPHPRGIFEEFVLPRIASADFVLAYNHEFDKTVLEEECKRHGLKVPEANWLCGLHHVPYPDHFRCRQLSHLALDHGIQVDPTLTHGALADCKLFLNLLRASGFTFQEMLDYRDDPWVYIKAEIPKPWEPGGEEANKAVKEDGYAFEKAKGTDGPVWRKTWVKRVKSKSLEAEKAKKVPFPRSLLSVPA